MNSIVKITLSIAIISVLSGCSIQTSDRVNVDPNTIKYVQDSRTGLCFAATAAVPVTGMKISGIGFGNVPCTDEVLQLINK